MASLSFQRLNNDWNAEPNAPDPRVRVSDSEVRLSFLLNPFAYEADEDEVGYLTFEDCFLWRLGSTNDEGWYSGQCRYSRSAPEWGYFYELLGDDELRMAPNDWHSQAGSGNRHFMFYLRDATFECIAAEWRFERATIYD